MRLESRKYLYDILQAANSLSSFATNKTFAEYEADAMFRAAVERQFEIIGEALAQLARIDQELASRIGDYQRIIAFRNILIHGYAEVDNLLVWDILQTKLPFLREQVNGLMEE